MRTTADTLPTRHILRVALATLVLLMLPLVAMQFTDEVNWTLMDFLVAGTLLFGSGLAYEFLAARARNLVYRAAVGMAVGTALLLVWSNLAVGIIGSEDNPANLMYAGVLATLVVGSIIARFRPSGMARALFATAVGQMVVALIVVIADIVGLIPTFIVNVFFTLLWIGAALLFRRAAVLQRG